MINQGEACRAGGAVVGQINWSLQPGASMVEWKSEGVTFRERPSADPVGGFHHKHAEAESLQAVRRGDASAAGPDDDDVWRRRWCGGFHGGSSEVWLAPDKATLSNGLSIKATEP